MDHIQHRITQIVSPPKVDDIATAAALDIMPSAELYNNGLVVIGAGWGRTGTMSLKVALTIITQGPCYHMKDNIMFGHNEFWIEAHDQGKNDDEWKRFFKQYSACVDVPSCIYWEDILKSHPNAKVVLSTRSSQSWCKSVQETVMNFQPGNESRP